MSANWDPKDDWAYVGAVKNKESLRSLQEYFAERFEFNSMVDAMQVRKEMTVNAFYRRYCMVRFLTFPLEMLVTLPLLGFREAHARWVVQKALGQFILGRSSRSELLKSLARLPL